VSERYKDTTCPRCERPLKAINFASSYLNPEQWESIVAGRFYCDDCPSVPKERNRGKTGFCYWWPSEIEAAGGTVEEL